MSHGIRRWIGSPRTRSIRHLSKLDNSNRLKNLDIRYGCFLKWWVSPTTMGFPTKNDHFGLFWGYHHFRKPPYLTSLLSRKLFYLVRNMKNFHVPNLSFRDELLYTSHSLRPTNRVAGHETCPPSRVGVMTCTVYVDKHIHLDMYKHISIYIDTDTRIHAHTKIKYEPGMI